MNSELGPAPDILGKTPLAVLREQLDRAQEVIPVGTIWQHYKGERYRVVGHTVDKNTNDLRVIYAREEDRLREIPFDCLINEWQEPLETPSFSGTRFTQVA